MKIRNFSECSNANERRWRHVRFVSLLCTVLPFWCWGSHETAHVNSEAESYTIQFSDVSLSDLVRFVGKITGRNFVYPESGLNERITFSSSTPASPQQILELLIQILKINSFEISEQGSHFLIFPSTQGSPLYQVVDSNTPLSESPSALVTKVFQIKFADVRKIKEIVSKILNENSLSEVIEDAQCLIVKDTLHNIKRVEELVSSVDREEFDLGFVSYQTRNLPITTMKEIADQVLAPMIKGQSFSMIENNETGELHIVASRPALKKIIPILEQIDRNQVRALFPGQLIYDDLREGLIIDTELEYILDLLRIELSKQINEDLARVISLQQMVDQQEETIRFIISQIEEEHKKSEESYNRIDEAIQLEEQNDIRETIIYTRDRLGEESSERITNLSEQLSLLRDTSIKLKGQVQELSEKIEIKTAELKKHDAPKALPDKTNFDIRSLDQRYNKDLTNSSELFSYRVQHQPGISILSALKDVSKSMNASAIEDMALLSALNSVQWMPETDLLIFFGQSSVVCKIEEILQLLDVPMKQVLVELLIVDASIEESLEFGVDAGAILKTATGQWAGFGGNIPSNSSLGNSLVSQNPSSEEPISESWATPGSGFSSGVMGKLVTYKGQIFSTLGGLVHALNANGKVQVVMNPKIISEEKTPAEFFVGETTRVKVNTQQNTSTPGIIINGFEIRDVGSKIRVLPKINNEDSISLEIDQEISEATQSGNSVSDAAALIPLTKTTRTKTKVLVPNQGFVILSGMTHERIRKSKATLPIIGDIPLISWLFSKTVSSTDKRNLLIFIRAQIIHTAVNAKEISDDSIRTARDEILIPDILERLVGLFSPPSL